MITFHKVRFKNLLSFGNMMTEVQLDRNSSTLIQGKNGGGKSSVLDAICFALFGKPFRKINKPNLVNHKNKKDLLVEIEFTTGETKYMIRRGMNPQLFEIFRDDVMIDQSAAVKDYQVYLEQHILKFDFQAFTQLVILGKATYVSFLRLQAADRRKFIENILGLTIFGTMNEIHKMKVSELKDSMTNVATEVKIMKEKISVRKQYIQDLEEAIREQHQEAIKKIDSEISAINAQILSHEQEFEKVNGQLVEIKEDFHEKLQGKLEQLIDFRSRYNLKISQLDNHTKFFEINTSCPTCGQEISDELREIKKNEGENKISDLQYALDKILSDISEVNESLDHVNDSISNNSKVNARLQEIGKMIKALRIQLQSLEESKTDAIPNRDKVDSEQDLLTSLMESYNDLLNQKSKMLEKAEYFDLISSMLKDTGIKSMVIKKFIPVINSSINGYLKQLGFFAKFVLDENFEEKIFSRGIDELSYGNFSEGEKLRIDLAILMAWRDVAKIQSNMSTNLLIFDEILDASIDQGGADAFLEILSKMHNTNVFIVSHSADRWSDKFRSSMMFEKQNGFSGLMVAG